LRSPALEVGQAAVKAWFMESPELLATSVAAKCPQIIIDGELGDKNSSRRKKFLVQKMIARPSSQCHEWHERDNLHTITSWRPRHRLM
jgi:hypothetical protein